MPAWFSLFHPFFVSVTEIKHDAAKKELQVSCRIFYDDLENALKTHYKTPVDILHPANRKSVDALVADYLGKHLLISVDGKTVVVKYLGYQIEEEAAWCYLVAEAVPAAKQVQVKDDILYNEHAEQINMIHVIVGGERKSTKLDNPAAAASFSF
ncbi:hypothetical protein GA0116948_101374 [Chitinophaga costaii]|uniref:Uncharacterized protein n=2 Tax=Chitinophaga costaii TaxID=1335309 RepID=A0A1C3ZFG3_9BACT|nr:hypothetical protein GA0116948_101374 [Chitinophaga costaii]